VVHPADIPTKDKERRNRNDNVDSRKIARNLRNGELTPLYVYDKLRKTAHWSGCV